MVKSYVIFLTFISLFHCMVQELTSLPDCGTKPGTSQTLKLAVNSKRNETGDWVDKFSVRTDFSNSSDSMNLDVTHTVTECEGRRVIYIQGVSNDPDSDAPERLRFHPRHGKNVALTNDRKTAYRISVNENHGVVYTDRPLRRNELFEVSLDRTDPKQPHNLGIGITSHTPYEQGTPDELIHQVSGMWLYYHIHVHINGNLVLHRYGVNLDDSNKFKIGDRVGVLVKNTGILHYYVNGVDQGPVDSNIPNTVYGVIELRSKAIQASITDSP